MPRAAVYAAYVKHVVTRRLEKTHRMMERNLKMSFDPMELRPTESPSAAPTITPPPSITYDPTPAPSETFAPSQFIRETNMPTPLFALEDQELSAARARNAILYPCLVAIFMISIVAWITIRDKLRQRKHVRPHNQVPSSFVDVDVDVDDDDDA